MGKHKVLSWITAVLLIVGVAKSENILSLMKKYEEESDLSKKTKVESLGHLVTFTRKDLELMHAYTLADVLKLVPLNNFLPNKYGVESLINPGSPLSISLVYRLYIDDHEVSSIHTYSPFLTYDRYPLDNIDHIEIYYSAGAIAVSNEPSQMIIKMYTKLPRRENASKVRVSLGTDKSYGLNFFSAKRINDYSCYLISFSKSYFRFPKPYINGNHISRNQSRKDLFIKYRYFDTRVEFSASDVDRDGFAGRSLDESPEHISIDSLDSYIVLTQKFDNSVKLTASYDYQNRKYDEENKASDGGTLVPDRYDPLNPPVSFTEDLNFHKFSFSLDKKINKEKNSLFMGTFLRYYIQDVTDNKYRTTTGEFDLKGDMFRVKHFYIWSFYAEDSFNINDKNLIIAGLRYDKFKFYGQKSKNRLNGRAGLISFVNRNFMLKGFLSHYHVLPSMIMIESSVNKRLSPMPSTVFTGEAKYTFGKNSIRLFYEYYRVKNIISYDQTKGGMVNTGKSGNFHGYGFFFRREIGDYTNVELNYWITDVGKDKYSPERGGYLRIGGDFDRFQIYSDIVYRGSYKPYGRYVRESFDLKTAVSVTLPRDWYLKITGENLLNKGEKIALRNGVFSINYRKITVTVEKVF
ncbi:iron complex outermembrane recepter protein [Persephonella hydrogeniphila]|uniref:Iron complex outermembrane recepter protein n=1 Tax=Persephonella hydrogeniphila TaxID=198703 RepID=A0A285NEA3_9AQUI|nr:TonB-dependent receptor [Persephonella hydrogeniphila]SNZ07822.1 iron complex outermembrane recepter protein [Persephonella hydrogeniphila]